MRNLALIFLLILLEYLSQVRQLILTLPEHSLDFLVHKDPLLGLVAEQRDLLGALPQPLLARLERLLDALRGQLELTHVSLVVLLVRVGLAPKCKYYEFVLREQGLYLDARHYLFIIINNSEMVEEAGGKSSSHMDKIPEAVIP